MKRVSIVGIVGVPAAYGGFETLAENLVKYNESAVPACLFDVYCSTKAYPEQAESHLSAQLHYIPLAANGLASIAYDIWGMLAASRRRSGVMLILGVSGAIGLPLIRLVSSAKIITNIDGIEWKREKWSRLARWILKLSEAIAVRCSHVVIADNQAIADYVAETYNKTSAVIPYGGDHALTTSPSLSDSSDLPCSYALALCRIEPENHVAMILEAFDQLEMPLVFVGNWDNSDYGRSLKARYGDHPNIVIHDPVYDAAGLRAIRDRATMYIHGHSAGGTNPALVEMMHFGIPVLAYDCVFNRFTTEEQARYFADAEILAALVQRLTPEDAAGIGVQMVEIARRRYTWRAVGEAYFSLLEL